MKFRSGFVSNSSSSSYVIHFLKESNKECPCCGRKTPNLLDQIDNNRNWDDETYVRAGSKNQILSILQDELHENIKWMKTREALPEDYIGPSGASKEQSIKWAQENIDETQGRISQVKNCSGKCVFIYLSYHDQMLNEEFHNQKNEGIFEVLWCSEY